MKLACSFTLDSENVSYLSTIKNRSKFINGYITRVRKKAAKNLAGRDRVVTRSVKTR